MFDPLLGNRDNVYLGVGRGSSWNPFSTGEKQRDPGVDMREFAALWSTWNSILDQQLNMWEKWVNFQWLLSWFLHKWREDCRYQLVAQVSTECSSPFTLMTTGTFSWKLFSELKLVTDNLLSSKWCVLNSISISNSMFWVQFGINSTSEWLLITRGEAECNYAIHECY